MVMGEAVRTLAGVRLRAGRWRAGRCQADARSAAGIVTGEAVRGLARECACEPAGAAAAGAGLPRLVRRPT